MNKHPLLPFIIGLVIISIACSLTTDAPPTLAPSTPMSTITPEGQILPPTLEPISVRPPSGVSQAQPQNIGRVSNTDLVDVNRMLSDVDTLVGFQTRHVLSSQNASTGIKAAETWLLNELRAIAATSPNDYLQIDVYPQQFQMEFAGQTVYPSNIVMSIQGTDAAAGVVIVSAHYDTINRNMFEGDAFQPGANDNATGVSALLELARIMVQEPHRATLVFVFFAAEETGRQGSLALVNDFIQPSQIPVVAVMNMDSTGSVAGRNGVRYDNTIRIFSEGPNNASPSRELARLIHVAGLRQMPDFVVELQDRVDRPGRWGDQMSFSEAGYPAIRLIEKADNTPIYHTSGDTADLIDPAYYRTTTQLALASLEVLVDGPNPPSLRPLRPSTTDPASLTLEWSFDPICQSYIVALRRAESLTYNDFYTVNATSLSWGGFKNYEAVTVSCLDADGQMGRFAPELLIPGS